jgi:hypothetical protein
VAGVNPKLSHNLARDLTTRPAGDDPAATFSQLRTSLIKVLRNSPESREPICDALELIETLQQQAEAKRHPDPPVTPERSKEDAPGRQAYAVQPTPEGDFLTERRPNGTQPFRCPKPTYGAAARILAETTAPLHFEEFLDRLNAAMGQRQADYRLRVCLRFWLAHGRVQRFRTRYRATEAGTFLREAEGLWDKARSA